MRRLGDVNVCGVSRYVVKFLARLAESSDVNKMTAANLSIVIAPSLLWPPPDNSTDCFLTGSRLVHVYFHFHSDTRLPCMV